MELRPTTFEARMQTLAISYVKRFKMEIDLAGLPPPSWPEGFVPVCWRPDLLEPHADTLAACFQGGIDAVVFPSLGSVEGCRALLVEMARRSTFIPEATWLLMGPEGPCGSVQALRERGHLGAIQNVGITSAWRGRRLGKALLLQALHGMFQTGLGRAILEVTTSNDNAIRLYQGMGFRRTRVVYKAISLAAAPSGEKRFEQCPVPV